MFGVPLEGPTNVLCDNKSAVDNSTIPSSTLKKKHNRICYHGVREAVAAKVIRIAHIPTGQNLADMFTKPLGAVQNYMSFANEYYIIWDDENGTSSYSTDVPFWGTATIFPSVIIH